MQVRFIALAAEELRAAHQWYAARSEAAAERFIEAVRVAVRRIESEPESHPTEHKQTRRAAVKRFPYRLVFGVVSEAEILVLAVVHDRRRPGYWRDRRA